MISFSLSLQIVCSSCLLLASKVEETLFSMRRLLLAIKKSLASQFNHLLLAISSYGDSGKVVAERLAMSIKQHEVRLSLSLSLSHSCISARYSHYVRTICVLGAGASHRYPQPHRLICSCVWDSILWSSTHTTTCRCLGAGALKSSFTSERALTHTTFMLLDCLYVRHRDCDRDRDVLNDGLPFPCVTTGCQAICGCSTALR